MRLNLRFIAAVKFHSQPSRILAELAGVDPKMFDDLLNRRRAPIKDDPTVLPVAEMLGFSADACFIEDDIDK
jgi:hypothetical protein